MECEYRCDIRTFFVLLLLLLLSFLQEIQEIQEFHNLTGSKKDTREQKGEYKKDTRKPLGC